MNEFSRQNRLVLVVVSLFLIVILASCQRLEAEASSAELPTFLPITTPEAGDEDVDEVGEYTIASTKFIQWENGSMIHIEERVYETLAKSRFVITQKNLSLQLESSNLTMVNFLTYQGGNKPDISSSQGNLILTNTEINVQALSSEVIAISELYDYGFDDSFELINSKENLAKKACGLISLQFGNEASESFVLDSCSHPTKPSS